MSLTNNPKEFFQWLETATEGTLFSFISEWHKKGESSEELIKFIEFLREKAPPLSLRDLADEKNAEIEVSLHAHLAYDCAGTGGDKSHSFNISTGTAFLAAYAGLPVIKNGGRSASSKVGSVDVLYELGLDLDISEEKKLAAFQKLGLSFFSSKISSEYLLPVKNLARKYKESCFINLIAPFLSPIELQGQMIGIAQPRWIPVIQEIARYFIQQGYRKKIILVHSRQEFSNSVLDEFTTVLPSKIIFLSQSHEQEFTLNPTDKSFSELGLTTAKLQDLEGGNTEENAQILLKIFQGEAQNSTLKIKAETLALNAALMLMLKKNLSLLYDETSLIKELAQNYIKLTKILETQNLYKFLEELRKYFHGKPTNN